ncbi:peroxisomal 2,4-dienoyl-CoA reductase [Dipodascopsis tothii]|uniref:peroxisomal 2,4-dienoyl-CoA reductase n=1 Tax=Dipodascopsis tothii TaxID=44089 RepID=UPI0034CDD733
MALLTGKAVAITGAASGIGRAIALEMARHGASVCINYYPDEPSAAAAAALGAQIAAERGPGVFASVAGDISTPEAGQALVAAAVAHFGKLDVFVSNAGICPFAEFTTMPADTYRRTVAVNLDGAFFATQAAARQMQAQGTGGSIIGVSSISALVGGGLQTHYTPTKAGVLSLMQSCAVALGQHGIRCNALLPGTIRTGLNEADLVGAKGAAMAARVPLGRLGEPADLAGPAVFLASDLSCYVTGAQVLVDGGLFVNLQ